MAAMPNSGLPGAEGPPTDQAKMIVFGVSFSTTKEGFREYWAQYGELAECELMFGRDGRCVSALCALCCRFPPCCYPPVPFLRSCTFPRSPCDAAPGPYATPRALVTQQTHAALSQIAWVWVRAVPR